MSVNGVINAVLSVEWFLGASMALAFERAVRDVINSRLKQAAGDDNEA